MLAGGRFAVLALLAAPVVGVTLSAQPNEGALRLKAAFVFQFPQFVGWPPAALDGSDSFELCVFQSSGPLAGFLEELVSGEAVKGRPIHVSRIRAGEPITHCHTLVAIGRAEDGAAVTLKQAAGHPILTVGDTEGFLDDGGIIALKIVNQRVRFEIDVANAQRAGLQLSSQLLRLALTVRGGPS